MKPNLALILAITAALGALPLATEGGWAKGGVGVTAVGVTAEEVMAEEVMAEEVMAEAHTSAVVMVVDTSAVVMVADTSPAVMAVGTSAMVRLAAKFCNPARMISTNVSTASKLMAQPSQQRTRPSRAAMFHLPFGIQCMPCVACCASAVALARMIETAINHGARLISV
jgi:hypothetical protein